MFSPIVEKDRINATGGIETLWIKGELWWITGDKVTLRRGVCLFSTNSHP
jgi:hypothetical protein